MIGTDGLFDKPEWYAEEIDGIAALGLEIMQTAAIIELQKRWHAEVGFLPARKTIERDVKSAQKRAKDDGRAAAQGMIFANVREFNETHFVVKMKGKPFFCFWESEPDEFGGKRIVLRWLSRRELLEAHEHERVPGPVPGEPGAGVAEEWLRFRSRVEYRGLAMDARLPGQPIYVDGLPYLNQWRGWGVEPAEGDASLFVSFIEEVIADGDPRVAKYVLDWLAWVVQHPDQRVGVALVLVGAPGTGKGTLGNLLVELFGAQGQRVGSKDEVIGQFNDHLLNCCFLFADEALFAGDKAAADRLKGMFTEPQLQFNGKFMPLKRGRNHISPMMATNHDWALTIGVGDRRHFVTRVSDCRKGDADYWTRLHGFLRSKAGKAAVLHALLTRDVETFHAENDRPVTEIYRAQIEASLEPDHRWWHDVLLPALQRRGGASYENPYLPPVTYEAGVATINKVALFARYEKWLEERAGYRHRYDPRGLQKSFWMRAWPWLRKVEAFEIDRDSGRCLVIPDIEAFGAQLERHLFGEDSPSPPIHQS